VRSVHGEPESATCRTALRLGRPTASARLKSHGLLLDCRSVLCATFSSRYGTIFVLKSAEAFRRSSVYEVRTLPRPRPQSWIANQVKSAQRLKKTYLIQIADTREDFAARSAPVTACDRPAWIFNTRFIVVRLRRPPRRPH